MVAQIAFPKKLEKPLNYNENKVRSGVAKLIGAENFLKDVKEMKFYEKLNVLKDRMELNDRASTKLAHISLNFHPTEQLSNEKLLVIARQYMERIGFGEQPYLVYLHQDAGHPHVHILTTMIREDGSRIYTHNIGKGKSMEACRELEKQHGLVVADGKAPGQAKEIRMPEAKDFSKLIYGKTDLRNGIKKVLNEVLRFYKFTSLEELNTVLKQYNVLADIGAEDSRIRKNKGLLIHALKDGKTIGVPLKASYISKDATLKVLEQKFEKNQVFRKPLKYKLKTAIDWALSKRPATLYALITELKKDNVQLVPHTNTDGKIYGLTFIDFRSGAVFKGSDLGKGYSSNSIMEKLNSGVFKKEEINLLGNGAKPPIQNQSPQGIKPDEISQNQEQKPEKESLLDVLMTPERELNRLPYELLKKKKKRGPQL